ncbi:mutator type transposase [Tanacetum coccineum]
MTQEKVIGDHTTQYAQLRQYVLELKERNPDTTVKIDVERNYEPDSPTRKFRRIYILTAVGVDLNNGTYPLAYSVVEYETKQSWLWFLDCLGDDLELFRNSNFTFVTDRQKGLILALAETFLCAEHRCATTTTVSHFNRNMEELKSANKDVYDWLKDIPPQHWARSYFSATPHYDVLLNNMCEVISKSTCPLTPNATKIFDVIKKKAA